MITNREDRESVESVVIRRPVAKWVLEYLEERERKEKRGKEMREERHGKSRGEKKKKRTREGEEEFISREFMSGILPDPLLDAFHFWKIERKRRRKEKSGERKRKKRQYIIGYGKRQEECLSGSGRVILDWWGNHSFLLIELEEEKEEREGNRWKGIVHRVPLKRILDSNQREKEGKGGERGGEEREMVLLDVLFEERESTLGEIAQRMGQLDNFSHILVIVSFLFFFLFRNILNLF